MPSPFSGCCMSIIRQVRFADRRTEAEREADIRQHRQRIAAEEKRILAAGRLPERIRASVADEILSSNP